MREHNTGLVVRTLWESPEGLSRADLSRRLGLSRSTISAIVQGLLASGLVLESHRARSTGGRRPIVLQFNAEHHHLLGVDMGASHLTVVRTDLRGRVQDRASRSLDVEHDPEVTLQALPELIEAVLPEGTPPLLGLGVGVPCPVDADSSHQLSPRILPAWRGVQLGDWLYERYRIPVFLDNDANVGALAEAWWGAGRETTHFAYIKLGTGVGAGYVIDRGAYRGASGIAGEIGHTTVSVEGRPCRCGLRGCLEAEIGSGSLVAKAREALDEGATSTLAAADPLTLAVILDQAEQGDLLAADLIEEAGRHLGVALANLLNLLNPEKVVLGGLLTRAGDRLLFPLRRTVRDRALSSSLERADIVLGELGSGHVAVGAATLVLQHALAEPHLFIRERVNGASTRPPPPSPLP